MTCKHCGSDNTIIRAEEDSDGPFGRCWVCGDRITLWFNNPTWIGPLPVDEPTRKVVTFQPKLCLQCGNEFIPRSSVHQRCDLCSPKQDEKPFVPHSPQVHHHGQHPWKGEWA